jgi:Zn-finger nucleic acid-binding protein
MFDTLSRQAVVITGFNILKLLKKFTKMKCPSCNVSLVMSDRSGIEIDYCPECRGVWLDRGELDKIIERSNQNVAPRPTENYREKDQYNQHADYKYKKKKGLLGDLFDF